ncbi:uncharacterized protein LOC114354996 [Ostrinia furnacalis]|uniref:uncharacterized protein LOC114354996 n=1 Tax=Ostrinia furnacalis TaxID=93504 RepID=UPI00103D1465|nr:uncharacterized protein LOC114354996 [Ostrinia furnacalis]
MSAYNHNSSFLDNINLAAISDIGNEIDPCDMISIMFLLYEDPHLALRNLTVYLRVSNDIGGSTCNLLKDWASHAQTRSTWKAELVEALATCQLNTVVRKFGFDTPATRSCTRNSTETSYLHPMKKIFYMVCENLDSKSYEHFKNLIKVAGNLKKCRAFSKSFIK